MSKFAIRIKDRQTGRSETIWIEANSRNEAKAIAIQRFGVSHEVIGYILNNTNSNGPKILIKSPVRLFFYQLYIDIFMHLSKLYSIYIIH